MKIGDLLRELTSRRSDAITIATLKEALAHILDAARELGAVERENARLRRYIEKVETANSRLMQVHSDAHAEREQLVRDLVPTLDVITDVFNRARQMRDALAPSSRPYIPPRSAASIDALTDYREAPVEAHHGE